jgi:hypothetical protein
MGQLLEKRAEFAITLAPSAAGIGYRLRDTTMANAESGAW